jgi:hypothetical protein
MPKVNQRFTSSLCFESNIPTNPELHEFVKRSPIITFNDSNFPRHYYILAQPFFEQLFNSKEQANLNLKRVLYDIDSSDISLLCYRANVTFPEDHPILQDEVYHNLRRNVIDTSNMSHIDEESPDHYTTERRYWINVDSVRLPEELNLPLLHSYTIIRIDVIIDKLRQFACHIADLIRCTNNLTETELVVTDLAWCLSTANKADDNHVPFEVFINELKYHHIFKHFNLDVLARYFNLHDNVSKTLSEYYTEIVNQDQD